MVCRHRAPQLMNTFIYETRRCITTFTIWRGWEDNIKMNLGKTGLKSVDWIHLAQDRDRWRVL
jgi:hypothetical protein